MSIFDATPRPDALAAHEARTLRDLALIGVPAKSWTTPVRTARGEDVLDVAIIGAGMNGIAVAGALLAKGVTNIALFDANAPGLEGPWNRFARMDTLRSPKTLTGPALGVPALTFGAWFSALYGEGAWEALYKIPNAIWVDYLAWLQKVLALPVRHGHVVSRLRAPDGLLAFDVAAAQGAGVMHARRVVLATGRGGAGGDMWPGFIDAALAPDLAAHANGPIDFERLRGKSVAVLGGSATAWDNATTAIEQGAARADMYLRRPFLPQVNKGRGSAHQGYFHGVSELPDAEKWALAAYLDDHLAPPPHETVFRGMRASGPQERLGVNFGHRILAARRDGARIALDVETEHGRRTALHDFLIVATGFRVDADHIAELGDLSRHVARWADRFPPSRENAELAKAPYLGPGFELSPRGPDAPAELAHVHLVNYGALVSHGAIASDVPGTAVAGERAARAIVASLFAQDIGLVRADLAAFSDPELIDTPYYRPDRQTA